MEPRGRERHGREAPRASEWEFASHYPATVARATYRRVSNDKKIEFRLIPIIGAKS